MPRKVKKPAEPAPVQTADYLLTVKLLNEFRHTWTEQFKEAGVSATLFSRLSLVAMTQVAAIVGVDVGMTQEQFLAVCRANFNEAYSKAPKFGP
jgi:hypothetical protein